MIANNLVIRPIEIADQPEWRRLWTSYLEFYETSVSDEVYQETFRRLIGKGEFEPNGFLVLKDSKPIGLVHYIQHRTCWSTKNNCYLQDLFVEPDYRGTGIGRALIEAVYTKADELDLGGVYWLTQEHNATARVLYDRIGRNTKFIRYIR